MSAAEKLIASAKGARSPAWRPTTPEMLAYMDTIARHNATARSSERVGAPRLASALSDDFGLAISTATVARYMQTRAKELGL